MHDISKRLQKHYDKTFERYGPTSAGVDWGDNEERVILRYKKILATTSESIKEESSLLDVGCGYGGLLNYAINNNIKLHYTGIDVSNNMIKWATENLPLGKFIHGDILNQKLEEKFDYVVCNGILTQKLETTGLEMDQFAGKLIKRMFALCNVAIAFNVMSTKVNFYSNNLYYRNPAELFSWCISEISESIKLDHSYPLYEYTIYLYRDKFEN